MEENPIIYSSGTDKDRKKISGTCLLALLIIAASSYFAVAGLGHNYFWDDEAGTAIYARNLLASGKLTAWDGRNLLAYGNGSELDDYFINRYFPPLQFLLAATAFRFFGFSTVAARLPFVLIGLASLWFFFLLLWGETGRNRACALGGLLLLALSPSFLLFIRQCRYFSLAIFFPVFIYFHYRRYLLTGRPVHLIVLTIGFLGLFFSHYLICLVFAMALLLAHAVFNFRARKLPPFLVAGFVFLAVTTGYFFGFGVILPDTLPELKSAWLLDRLTLAGRNFREINSYAFFPWMMLFPLAWLLADKKFDQKLRRQVGEWLFLIVVFTAGMSLFSPQTAYPRGSADIRYLLPLLPFCASLLGVIVFFLGRKSRPAGGAVLLLLIFSNFFAWTPFSRLPLRLDLINYVREIHRDYRTAYEAVVDFISEKCEQDDVLVVISPNMADSLQFYAGDRVIFGGRLDRNTRLPLKRVRELNPDLLAEECRPDWIVSFRMRPLTQDLLDYYTLLGMEFELFETLEVYYLGEAIRPEVLLRQFGERKFFPPEDRIFIFKRTDSGVGNGT